MPQRQMHREVFFAHNGPGPYSCFGCKLPVYFFENLHVHHIDKDHQNDNPLNLSATHHGCHSRLHHEGFPPKGSKLSAAHRAAISAGHIGLKRSDAAKARMSASQKGRTFSPEHRQKIAATLKSKMTPEQRLKMAEMGHAGRVTRWGKGKA